MYLGKKKCGPKDIFDYTPSSFYSSEQVVDSKICVRS